jgi:hypothetical protein
MPTTEAPTETPVRGVGAEALVSAISLEDIAPLLIAWQQTREAIGSVEAAQPRQLSDAMAGLIAARNGMERCVCALFPLVISR